MNRRELLLGLLGLGVVGAGGWLASTDLRAGKDRVESHPVEAINAPGSDQGRLRVPLDGTITVIDLFATWCSPCQRQMEELRTAHARISGEARFVSVTNEAIGDSFTRNDLRSWWQQHGGRWTVALDIDGAVTREVGAPGLPFTAVVTPGQTLHWTHHGVASSQEIITNVHDAA